MTPFTDAELIILARAKCNRSLAIEGIAFRLKCATSDAWEAVETLANKIRWRR
jgi:hypothetical protein